MSRRLGVVALAVVATVAAGIVSWAAPATARPQPVVVIQEGAPTIASFDGIPGNNPSSQEVDPIPSDCVNPHDVDQTEFLGAGALTLACDVVPLKIVPPPALSEADDWFVIIDIEWEPAEQVDEVGAVNDLDIYLYDNMQVAKRDNPDSTTYTQFGKAASAVQPEGLKVFRPDLGDYNLVVNNFSGPNVNYTLKARIETSLFESPFEVLGPAFAGARDTSEDASEEAAAPVDHSADTPAPDAPFIGAVGGAAPALAEVAVMPDTDFLDFDSGSSFDDQLSAPARQALPVSVLRSPPSPVGGAVLFFWFVLAPLAVGAAVFFLVVRRNRVRLTA